MSIASLNVPHFKQELPYSCVAACARMVLAHYGRQCTEEELRLLVGTWPHGTPARGLFRLQSLGFDVQLESSSLGSIGVSLIAGVPPIVFLETSYLEYWTIKCDHVAVVVGVDLLSVSLNDPHFDGAPQQTSLNNFQAAWASNEQLTAFIRPKP